MAGQAEPEDVVGVRGLTLTAPGGRAPVLVDVSFEVPRGSRVALLGANGSGKTMLLLALAGAVPARVERRRIPGPVGLVVQDPGTGWTSSTVEDEIQFSLACRGISTDEATRRTDAALARFHLSDLRFRPPLELSGGEQQRVQLAAVMAAPPSTLLLDEPTAFLDPAAARRLEGGLASIRPDLQVRAGHDPEGALEADHVLILVAGRVAAQGAPAEVLAAELPDGCGFEAPPACAVARILERRGELRPPLPLRWSDLDAAWP